MMKRDSLGSAPGVGVIRSGCGAGLRLAAVVLILAGAGCSQAPEVELPDPATGQYLTLEQQRSLNSVQLQEYCGMLDQHLQQLRDDIDLAYALKDSLDQVYESMSAEATQLNRDTRKLERDVKSAKQSRASMIAYVTQEGDTLIKLAALFFDSAAEWRKIYDANAELIEDPGEPLPVGLVLRIPN